MEHRAALFLSRDSDGRHQYTLEICPENDDPFYGYQIEVGSTNSMSLIPHAGGLSIPYKDLSRALMTMSTIRSRTQWAVDPAEYVLAAMRAVGATYLEVVNHNTGAGYRMDEPTVEKIKAEMEKLPPELAEIPF